MADTKTSDLTAASTLDGTEVFAVAQAGASKKATLAQVAAYVEGGDAQYNASVADQGPGFAADTYVTGSAVAIPNGRLQAKSMYRIKFRAAKTAAGTATPIITIRIGTAGTTADTARCTLTFAAQTAVVDEGWFELFCTFRTVGSGTSAVLSAVGSLQHRLSVTGFSTDVSGSKTAVSSGFDSTVLNSIVGISVNGGTSAAWTIFGGSVQAELFNLA